MKRIFTILGTTILSLSILAGCGGASTSTDSASSDDKTITVAATASPHGEILEQAKEVLADEGYTLNIKIFNDYVLPNTATANGEVDATYHQHQPYLDNYNAENGTDLVSAASIHYEPFAIYAGKTASLDALADGATVAVPNDVSNEARALLLLQDSGLLKLKDGAGINATKLDIVENPKNLQIQEIEAAQVARTLQDVDIAVINGNYALEAGLKVADALAVEADDSIAAQTYANIIAVKPENKDSEKIKALVSAIESDKVKQYINDTYKGAVVPLF